MQSITAYCNKYELGDLLSKVDCACYTECVQKNTSAWKKLFRKHKNKEIYYSFLTPGFLIVASLGGQSDIAIKAYLLEKMEVKNHPLNNKDINTFEIIGISLGSTQRQSLFLNLENSEATQTFIKLLNERSKSSA